jgi:hypothetical protein
LLSAVLALAANQIHQKRYYWGADFMCMGGSKGTNTVVQREPDQTKDTSVPEYRSSEERNRYLYRKNTGFKDEISPSLARGGPKAAKPGVMLGG